MDIDGSNDLYAQWRINQYSYTVEYYIDGVKDDTLTVTNQADFGAVISSYTDKCPSGYALDKTESLPLTIGVTESENVIKVFYKKNVFDLTIHYVYADGGTAAADHTDSVTFGASYSVTSPAINGYTADQTTVSGTMPANNVEVTVTYSKRTDLSYTVNYYWNNTTHMQKEKYQVQIAELEHTLGELNRDETDTEETLIGTKRWAAIAEEYSDATELSKGMLNACVELMDDTVLNLCLGEHRVGGADEKLDKAEAARRK